MPRSSSSRRANKWARPHRELGASLSSVPRATEGPDGTWVVQQVRGSSSGKVYTCPGCRQDLPARIDHIVAWRSEEEFGFNTGVGARRHWHKACFRSRPPR